MTSFGAVGDGITDDSSAIQAAIASVTTPPPTVVCGTSGRTVGGAVIYFPPTTAYYRLTSGLAVPRGNFACVGDPSGGSVIRLEPQLGDTLPSTVLHARPFEPYPPPYPSPPPLDPGAVPSGDCSVYYVATRIPYADGEAAGQEWTGFASTNDMVEAMTLWRDSWQEPWLSYWKYINTNYIFYVSNLYPFPDVDSSPAVVQVIRAALGEDSVWERKGVFNHGHGQGTVTFDSVHLDGGGILLGSEMQRWTAMRDCTFHRCPDWAVRSEETRIVGLVIERCDFTDCAGGVTATIAQNDFWTLRDCSFAGTRGVDVEIASSTFHLERCHFRDKPDDFRDFPFLRLKAQADPVTYTQDGDAWVPTGDVPGGIRPTKKVSYVENGVTKCAPTGGRMPREEWSKPSSGPGAAYGTRIVGCTFGQSGLPPRDLVIAGPIKEGTYADYYEFPRGTFNDSIQPLNGVVFEDCNFGGTDYSASDVHGRSAVNIKCPTRGLHMIGCRAENLLQVVREDAIRLAQRDGLLLSAINSSLEVMDTTAGRRRLSDRVGLVTGRMAYNVVQHCDFSAVPCFTRGGRGFEVAGDATRQLARRGSPSGRPRGNLLMGTTFDVVPDDRPPQLIQEGGVVQPPSSERDWQYAEAGIVHENLPWGVRLVREFGPTGGAEPRLLQWLAPGVEALLERRGAPLVFSVWLRPSEVEGTVPATHAFLHVAAGPLIVGGSRSIAIPLARGWQRYGVIVESLPEAFEPADGVAFDNAELPSAIVSEWVSQGGQSSEIAEQTKLGIRLFHRVWYSRSLQVGVQIAHLDPTGTLPEALDIAKPQLEFGDQATPWIPTAGGTISCALPWQSKMVGTSFRVTLGAGDAPSGSLDYDEFVNPEQVFTISAGLEPSAQPAGQVDGLPFLPVPVAALPGDTTMWNDPGTTGATGSVFVGFEQDWVDYGGEAS